MNSVRLFTLEGAKKRDPAVERWLSGQSAGLGTIAQRWFSEIRTSGPDVTELLHDGHPTACVQGLAFAYVNAFTSHVNVGFFLGANLPDPSRLLEGTGRFMRHVKLRPGLPANESALRTLIAAAYADTKALLRSR